MLLGPVGNKALPGPGDESVDFVIGYKEEEFNVLLKRLRDLSRKNPQKVTKLFGDFLEELGTILNEDKNEERLEDNRSPVVTNQDEEQTMSSEDTLALVQFMVWAPWAPWAPNTINICWAPKMSWAPIASKKHVGSNGSPAHFGSPADIDGVGSPGSPGRPDRGGKPREPRRGKPRNSKRC